MKANLYVKISLISVLGALAISLISLFCLVRISDMAVEEFRYGYLLNLASRIEQMSLNQKLSRINLKKIGKSEKVPQSTTLVDVTEGKPEKGVPASLWLVDENGKILTTNSLDELPVNWNGLPHPKETHEMTSNETLLLKPKTFVIRLDTTPASYLITHNTRSLFQGPFLWIQGTHAFLTASLATLLALSLSFYYLRRKSHTAREVLARIEAGDLKARFEVKKFDEFGNLILDFNRMADQIERLVGRIRDTEASRSNLLQELGHDLRTPLTSLNTSFETLRDLNYVLTEEDRKELFTMIEGDVHYFKELLEKLTMIATIEEPHYRRDTQSVDMVELLEDEIKNRQLSSGSKIKWNLNITNNSAAILSGDQHLLTRLIKNAFDNASRYARNFVDVKLVAKKDFIELLINDDGPGLTPESLESFGKRRERREVREHDLRRFSLGLGSVIMKSIAEVHLGKLSISNRYDQHSQIAGAQLKVTFKSAL